MNRQYEHQKILNKIYSEIFTKIGRNTLDVFLCGGASTKGNISSRDVIRKKLENNKYIRILYPEDLFIDMMNRQPSYNLLQLEKLLADNVDYICIVCESVGSYVELGAFASIEEIVGKVIALVKTKYKNDDSFIMLGPIKYIIQNDSKHVIYYNKSIDEAINTLEKNLKSYLRNKKRKQYEINNIVGLHYYMMFIILFYDEINVEQFLYMIKKFINNDVKKVDFKTLYSPAVKLLYKERLMEKIKKIDGDYYKLTRKSKEMCYNILQSANIKNIDFVVDKIKMAVIKANYY